MKMGNICGCNCNGKKVGVSHPVPSQYQELDLNRGRFSYGLPSYLDIDLTSVLIGGVASTVLIYILFGKFWGRN